MEFKIKYKLLILTLLVVTLVVANTRVGFSRPSAVIRTPGTTELEAYNQYIVGFSTELLNLSDLNYAATAFFQGVTAEGYHYGITYTTPPAISLAEVGSGTPSQIGFHVHKQVFSRNQISVIVGSHDILYDASTDYRISLFTSFAHQYKINNQYHLESTFGFGTGYISRDSHNYLSTNNQEGANFFAGFKLHIPYRVDYGGIKVLAEYDGWGINIGASIPITDAWTINMGVTHFENIAKFNSWNSNDTIIEDAPALVIGFQMNIPNLNYPKTKSSISNWSQNYNFINTDEVIDSLMEHANSIISALEDSLMLINEEKKTWQTLNNSLNYKINNLLDSLNAQQLIHKIDNHNLNKTLKKLSHSLEAYYNEEYSAALELTSEAIELMPDLAICYARKGSIYYKIGDVQRAIVNWNFALNLDPEYIEVRDVLLAIKDNNKAIKLPE